jgi:hypothetical protein
MIFERIGSTTYLLLLDRGNRLSLGLGRIELGLSNRSRGGLSGRNSLLDGLLDLGDDNGLLGGGGRDKVGLLLFGSRALDLLEEGAEDASTLGGLGLLSDLLLLLLLGHNRGGDLGLNGSRGSGLSLDGSRNLNLGLLGGSDDIGGVNGG